MILVYLYCHLLLILQILIYVCDLISILVLRPNITDITFTPQPVNTSLLLNFTNSQLMTCSASGGPRIMTMWLFDDGSSLLTVANSSGSVTHNISSSSTSDTGTYYCIATIDGLNDTSDTYTLFGESYISVCCSTVKVAIKQ